MQVVRVWVGHPYEGGHFNGTAFFISGNTLLTAKHVITDSKGEKYSNVYLSDTPDGGIVPISEIILCKRDISVLKIKKKFNITDILFINDLDTNMSVKICGFHDKDGARNTKVHNISGYLNTTHTYELQNHLSAGLSGSPVFLDDKICGIAQAINPIKNITYIIPIEESCSDIIKNKLISYPKKNHIFIDSIYDKDEYLIIKAFSEELKKLGHEVYFSQKDELLKSLLELKECKYFILFLSKETFKSEIVIEKIKEVKKNRQEGESFPTIIPIRFKLEDDYNINYNLVKLIEDIKPFIWKNSDDEKIILKELHQLVLNSQTLPQSNEKIRFTPTNEPIPNAPLKFPNGYDSTYYIERYEDSICFRALEWEERLIRIKAPRQFGKTSLIARLMKKEKAKGNQIIKFNFNNINKSIFDDIEKLLDYICSTISRKTKVQVDIESVEGIVPNDKAKEYIEELLFLFNKKIVLVIDDADELFNHQKVSNDFFSLIRALYEEANTEDDSSLNKLQIIISHSTEAKFATTNSNTSPFYNVGVGVELKPFSQEEFLSLAKKHNFNISNYSLSRVVEYIGGHPYLSRLTLYSMLNNKENLDDILTIDNELFSHHLRRYIWKLNNNEKYKKILKYILNNYKCKKVDDRECYVLESIGLIKHEKFTCKLYEDFFRDKL